MIRMKLVGLVETQVPLVTRAHRPRLWRRPEFSFSLVMVKNQPFS
jgi:hypothetical protein